MNNKAQGKVRCHVCKKWFKKRGLSKHMRVHNERFMKKVMEPVNRMPDSGKEIRLTEWQMIALCKCGELLLKVAETCPNATTAMALKYIVLKMDKVLKFVDDHEV